jgi:hypothetical protein
MKDLIKKILNEELTNRLSPEVILLFKLIQSKKKELKSKKSVIEFLEKRLKMIGKDSKEAQRYYYLYTLNYRENGDYENIRPEEFVNEKNFPALKVTNVSAGKYAYAKIPFEGSNVRGYWEKDRNGVEQYVITSYGWYPILVFKNGKWYSVSERYSRATSKQYSNVTRDGIYDTTILRSKDLKSLVAGSDEEKIKNSRINEFMENYKDDFLNSSFYSFMALVIDNDYTKISFDCKITNVELVGEKIVIDAEVSPKRMYKHYNFSDTNKEEVEEMFASQVFIKTKILNPEDVKINVKFVD